MSVLISLDKCTGCGQCLEVCPFAALELIDDKVAVKDGCTLCGACVEACEFGALSLPEDDTPVQVAARPVDGIWIFAEQRRGRLTPVALELLGEGRRLAEILHLPVAAGTLWPPGP